MTPTLTGYTYPKKLLIIYPKFKFNWVPCILPGNPKSKEGKPSLLFFWTS